jgi:hypothetical protein
MGRYPNQPRTDQSRVRGSGEAVLPVEEGEPAGGGSLLRAKLGDFPFVPVAFGPSPCV